MTAKATMTVATTTTTTTTTDDGVVATTHGRRVAGRRADETRTTGDGERALGGDARTLDGRLRPGRRRRGGDDTATQQQKPRRRRASGPGDGREGRGADDTGCTGSRRQPLRRHDAAATTRLRLRRCGGRGASEKRRRRGGNAEKPTTMERVSNGTGTAFPTDFRAVPGSPGKFPSRFPNRLRAAFRQTPEQLASIAGFDLRQALISGTL